MAIGIIGGLALDWQDKILPPTTADNTAYTVRLRLALREIAPFSPNVVYTDNVM